MRYMFWLCALMCACMCAVDGKNTLIMAVSQNIGAMNPQGYQGNAMFAQNAIYEGLVRLDYEGRIVPHLATSWEVSKDGKTYIFNLRKNVVFSNNEPFNADVVVLNFKSVLKNLARHSWSGLAVHISAVKKLGDYKVAIILKAPYAPTLSELAVVRPFRFLAPSAFPKDLDLIKHNPKPIGTGAYMLGSSKLGISDTLLKNPNYWDTSKDIFYDEIVLKVIFDPHAKLAALKSKQIDLIYGYDQIPLEIFKLMEQDNSFATYLSPAIYTTNLVLNSSSPMLSHTDSNKAKALRSAIIKSIDKTRLVKAIYGSLQSEANCIFINCDVDFTPDSSAESSIDSSVDKTMPIFKKGLSIAFSGDNVAHKKMAEIIEQDLKKLGIKATIKPTEPSIYRNLLLKGAFDIAFNDSWGAPYEPLSELHSMLIPSHVDYSAQSGLKEKPLIDSSIKALMSLDSATLSQSLESLLVLLRKGFVYMPLTYQRNKAIANKRIKGIYMGVSSYEVPFWDMYE